MYRLRQPCPAPAQIHAAEAKKGLWAPNCISGTVGSKLYPRDCWLENEVHLLVQIGAQGSGSGQGWCLSPMAGPSSLQSYTHPTGALGWMSLYLLSWHEGDKGCNTFVTLTLCVVKTEGTAVSAATLVLLECFFSNEGKTPLLSATLVLNPQSAAL